MRKGQEMDNKEYWEKYYNKNDTPFEPSLFAKWCVNDMLKEGDSVIELGCGNGRDAIYFAENGINVIAIDQCVEEINFLNSHYGKNIDSGQKLSFLADDFSNLGDMGKFNAVYSRFTLHAISEEGQDRALAWASESLIGGGLLLVEARGLKNEYFGLGTAVDGETNAFIYEDHYRRFLDLQKLVDRVEALGFDIVFADEDRDRAPFEDTNYNFLRLIARKR